MLDIQHNHFFPLREQIASMAMEIASRFNVEKDRQISEYRAIHIAVHEVLESRFLGLSVQNHIDREAYMIYEVPAYIEHQKRQTFFKFVDEMYKHPEVFTLREAPTPYGKIHQFGISLLIHKKRKK